MFGAAAHRLPAGRQVGHLQDGRVAADHVFEANDPAILGVGIGSADELPAVIVLVVGNQENLLRTVEDLTHGERAAVARLIKRPFSFRLPMIR